MLGQYSWAFSSEVERSPVISGPQARARCIRRMYTRTGGGTGREVTGDPAARNVAHFLFGQRINGRGSRSQDGVSVLAEPREFEQTGIRGAASWLSWRHRWSHVRRRGIGFHSTL